MPGLHDLRSYYVIHQTFSWPDLDGGRTGGRFHEFTNLILELENLSFSSVSVQQVRLHIIRSTRYDDENVDKII